MALLPLAIALLPLATPPSAVGDPAAAVGDPAAAVGDLAAVVDAPPAVVGGSAVILSFAVFFRRLATLRRGCSSIVTPVYCLTASGWQVALSLVERGT